MWFIPMIEELAGETNQEHTGDPVSQTCFLWPLMSSLSMY